MDHPIENSAWQASRAIPPAAIVWMLGLSQILGYGTLYYSFAILAGPVSAQIGWPSSWLFASLSLGLFLSGLIAPEIGRQMDRRGAGLVMALGSIGAALALFLAALAPNGIIFAIAVAAMQIAGGLVLYDAAFVALVQTTGPQARSRITHLTLIAGFASTISWPLTAWLVSFLEPRQILGMFAAVNLVVCVPIHALLALLPDHRARATTDASGTATPNMIASPLVERRILWLATFGFALSGFALSATLAQMVPILTGIGLGASALVVSALFGPAQVLVRFVNMLVSLRAHPIRATLIALALIPIAMIALAVSAPSIIGAALFAVLLGFGSGLKSIVQGTLPLALFGPASYASHLGRMASVRQIMAAIAPFALAFIAENAGATTSLWLLAAIGVAGILCMVGVARLASPARTGLIPR